MARTTPVSTKKRKVEEAMRGKTSKPRKRIKKQQAYHSSSEDEDEVDMGFKPVNLGDSDEDMLPAMNEKKTQKTPRQEASAAVPRTHSQKLQLDEPSASDDKSSDDESGEGESSDDESSDGDEQRRRAPAGGTGDQAGSDSGTDSGTDSNSDADGSMAQKGSAKSKRNDPAAFSTSMSKILSTKLPSATRADPVLSRSAAHAALASSLQDSRVEAHARARLRAEKLASLSKGRNTDVLGIERGMTAEVAEKENQLRKLATKGVVQLFNAFRGAHERAEAARRAEREKGDHWDGRAGEKGWRGEQGGLSGVDWREDEAGK